MYGNIYIYPRRLVRDCAPRISRNTSLYENKVFPSQLGLSSYSPLTW